MIPIVVISFNNWMYVKNTIDQIKKINNEYYKSIIILDNNSYDDETIKFLNSVDVNVFRNNENRGPWISSRHNVEFFKTLPEKFIMTDPDLQLNENLPVNFIDDLVELSNEYQCSKVGFALDISEPEKYFDSPYAGNTTIVEWEKVFWSDKIPNTRYDIYNSDVDTTFCLVNKNFENKKCIRVAGNFTAKHLPWYKENTLLNIYEQYQIIKNTTHVSTTAKNINNHINTEFIKLNKNDVTFFVKNNSQDPNLNFWANIFSNWENETFAVFDKFLNKDKIFIDIGGWIGTTCIYSSRKSKHVYVVEADSSSFRDLSNNCNLNSRNITCINKAIHNINEIDVYFGKNKFLHNSKENDSTSQIYENNTGNDCYSVKTITLRGIINTYDIDPEQISMIKVDIEGGEEIILDDLFKFYKETSVPMYISFHYSWWNNKDLNRFEFLTNQHKQQIINNPFISIMFT
jgi:FkbM family methyltransferase